MSELKSIQPVILCGGSGNRLWPLSRKSYPKQFICFNEEKSYFQQAIERVQGSTLKPIVITNDDYRFIVRQQILEADCHDADVLIEPTGKNTAPAAVLAAVHAVRSNPDSTILVMPSDHYISDASLFRKMVERAACKLDLYDIFCFGIKPSRPEIGYGYIKVADDATSITAVQKFTEKPHLELAKKFVKSGNFLWNSGIFLMKASKILEIAEKLRAPMLQATTNAYLKSEKDLDFIRIEEKEWNKVKSESFDYAFMETTKNIGCVLFDSKWSDMGDWDEIAREAEKDSDGNHLKGSSHQIDCSNTFLWATKKNQTLTAIGLDNIISIAMDDAILVANRSHTQHLKELVSQITEIGFPQATKHTTKHRPWGKSQKLLEEKSFRVNVLHVNAGASLSLQSHIYRSEHWIVVDGSANVLRNGVEFVLDSGENIYINKGDKHQLRNKTEKELRIIEVQTGSYLGDDNTVRYNAS